MNVIFKFLHKAVLQYVLQFLHKLHYNVQTISQRELHPFKKKVWGISSKADKDGDGKKDMEISNCPDHPDAGLLNNDIF